MPDLSDLAAAPLKGRLLLMLLAFGNRGLGRKAGLYRRNFIRLVDKAVLEYQEARSALVAQIEERQRPVEEMASEGRGIYIFGFVDHLENCINTTRRVLHLLDRLKSDQGAPPIPRQTRRLIEAYGKSVVPIRNIVEHMDERIRDDELHEGEPIMLRPGSRGDKAEIAGLEIKLSDLARVIRRLHEVGMELVEHPARAEASRS